MESFIKEIDYFRYYFSLMFSQIAGYWLAGMLLGSFISVFCKEKIHSFFMAMKNRKIGIFGLIPASLIGIASPLCMFGTIPISASFAENGMEEDWLAAFMMSSILLNPQILFYSTALGNNVLLIRFISCLICGITAGLLIRIFFRNKLFFNFRRFTDSGPNGIQYAGRDTDPNIFIRYIKNLFRNIKATGPAFIVGVTLAVLYQRFIPAEFMAALFGRHRAFGLLMAATIGVPLYVCGGGTIPLLMAWMAHGMSLGSASAFMIAGPAMKITNLGAVKIILGVKHFFIYIGFSVLSALLTGFFIDFFSGL